MPGFNQTASTMLLHRLYLWPKHRKSRVSLSSRGTNRVSSSIPTDKVADESFNLKCSYTCVYTRQFLRADKYGGDATLCTSVCKRFRSLPGKENNGFGIIPAIRRYVTFLYLDWLESWNLSDTGNLEQREGTFSIRNN